MDQPDNAGALVVMWYNLAEITDKTGVVLTQGKRGCSYSSHETSEKARGGTKQTEQTGKP